MSDNVVLIAPRPLRVSAAFSTQRSLFSPVPRLMSPSADSFSRLRPSEGDLPAHSIEDTSILSNSAKTSSPRLNLSSEALEEFLSILRPSFLSPVGHAVRSWRSDTSTIVVPERPQIFRPRVRPHSKSPSLDFVMSDCVSAEFSPVIHLESLRGNDGEQIPDRPWRAPDILDSPVSRTLTRNPFERQSSYDQNCPTALISQLSPSLLPLPASPSPGPVDLTMSAQHRRSHSDTSYAQ